MLSRQWKALTITLLSTFSLAHCATFSNSRPPADTLVTSKERAVEESIVRQQITSYAKQYLGLRYKYAGRTPTGFDCSGFTHFVMDNFNVGLSPSSRGQAVEGKKIELSKVRAGDLIFFRRPKSRYIFHVAMVYSNDKNGVHIIHSTSRGVVIDNLNESKYWKPKVYTARDVLSGSKFKIKDMPQLELPTQEEELVPAELLSGLHLNSLISFI